MTTRLPRALAHVLLFFVAFCSVLVHAAAFTPGNIVVVRVGTGAAALASVATATFIDEYDANTGVLVQSIAMPTAVNGAHKRLTLSGTATAEGLMTRSGDGRYLVLGGYDADVGTASVTSTSSSVVNRVFARVDTSGAVDTTTALSNVAATVFRGATSSDGTDFWASTSTVGTQYTILGSTVGTQVANSTTNQRGVVVAGGNLYFSTGSGTATRIAQVGTGLPTTLAPTTTVIDPVNLTSPHQFFFADLNPGEPGLDTLYASDDAAGTGIRKFTLSGGVWSFAGTYGGTPCRGLTGVVSGATVTLFCTTGAAILKITDNGTPNTNVVSFATAPANTAFRGLALAPEQPSTPTNRTVTLSVSATSTAEGGAAVTVTATTDGPVSGAKTVDLATSGTASAGDFTLSATTITIPDGATSGSVTLTPVDDALGEPSEVVTLSLTNPSSGLTIGTPATAGVTIVDNDAQMVTISASTTTGTEAAATVITLTASVSSPTASEQTVQLLVSGAGITAGDYTLSSTTIVIPSGATSGSVTVTIVNDAELEPNETLTLTLDSPSSGLVVGAPSAANILVVDDDTPIKRIYEIQGQGHVSPFQGQVVNNVPGIVTEVRSNGFFMQDEAGDGSDFTSDGIFVFTSTAPGVTVGSRVSVTGEVFEFRPDCTTGANNLACVGTSNDAGQYNLTATQIGRSGATPSVATTAVGPFTLPAPVVIGAGGRAPPSTRVAPQCASPNIEDFPCSPDPAGNAVDFFETLEGMRVRVNDPMAVSGQVEFEEFWVIGDGGVNASGVNGRGGITINANDQNGERILLNLTGAGTAANLANLKTGDKWTGAFDGILNYSFGDYKVDLPAGFVMPVPTPGHGLGREVTVLGDSADGLTIGSYNVENLAGTSPQAKFDELAAQIVTNLKAPHVLALMEVQDNDGTSGGCNLTVSASTTYSRLTAAIAAAGGPSYEVVQIDPGVCTDGGAQGGNIRVAFLYNPARVGFTPVAGGGTNVNTQVVNVGGEARLQHNPGRIDPANSAFEASRKPLAAEFTRNGKRFIAIANHWNSKGGDLPEHGKIQPPTQVTQPQRIAISNVVKGFVQSALNIDAQARIVVLGDLNDFPWAPPVANLVATTPPLKPLSELLLTNERYTYNFRGNSQVLDYVIVSPSLVSGAEYDVVHVNSEYAVQVSDHDPEVARLSFPSVVIEPPVVAVPVPQDVNGDLRSDVIYRNASTGQVWRFLANGLALESGALVYHEPNTAWEVVGDGDFDRNGSADLLYRNAVTGQVAMVRFGPGGTVIAANVFYTEPSASWQIVQTPDIDGDGRSDLVWWNSVTGQVYVMLMNGPAIKAEALVYVEPNTQWRIVASGDFTGGNRQDRLVWHNQVTGQVWLQQVGYADGAFSIGGQLVFTEPDTQWRIVGAADFDGDNRADLLWRNSATGLLWTMAMNDGAVVSQGAVYTEPNPQWVIVALGDYNGDGNADMLWRNSTTGQVFMLLLSGRTIVAAGMVYAEPNTAWELLGPGSYAP